MFQSGYSGGHTPAESPPPDVQVEELVFGSARRWEPRGPIGESLAGPSDMSRMVATIRDATELLELERPRVPWLPALPDVLDLAGVAAGLHMGERILLGLADEPERQAQPPVSFNPDSDGNLVVFGTGGTGKSALLRTIAVSAGDLDGPCQVYALDFAGGALSMLEELPHVAAVVTGDDGERVVRLLRTLETLVDERGPRWAAVRAGSLDDYRTLASRPHEPRVVLLVDGLAAFRQQYEFTSRSATWERFVALANEGRQLGVHVVVCADRPATLSASLGAAMPKRLVLRLADENDYAVLGLPTDVLDPSSPPGRGILGEHEIQVGVLGGTRSVAEQANAVARLAASMRRSGTAEAPPIGRLPARVALTDLPAVAGGLPVVGISDTDLQPLGVDPRGALVISGPPGSGRTTCLATLALAVSRWRPDSRLVYLGVPRSPLVPALPWAAAATDPDSVAALCKDVLARIEDDAAPFHFVVFEGVADLNTTSAESVAASLITALRSRGHGVVGDGEAATLTGFQAPLQALRADRKGFALQPDASEGVSLFQTPFGNPVRAEFPPGRGLYVVRGTAAKVQMAVPE